MITDTLNIHKSHLLRSFGLSYVSLFNISKHIGISVLFFIVISVSCFVFFCWIFENICPGVRGVLARFFLRVGNSPFQKIPRGFARGMVRLGID